MDKKYERLTLVYEKKLLKCLSSLASQDRDGEETYCIFWEGIVLYTVYNQTDVVPWIIVIYFGRK